MSQLQAPVVSVVIPTYERSAVVTRAVSSALDAIGAKGEVIVVDDGSTDDTRERIGALSGDQRLRYVHQPNGGRSVARNHGAGLARGAWLIFLDSDDELAPDALETHLAVATSRPEIGMIVAEYQIIDENGIAVSVRRPWEEGGDLDVDGWLGNCYALPGSVIIRRDWFERIGGFDPACEIAEDWALFLALAAEGCPMAWSRSVVCCYRHHGGNSTHDLARHLEGARRALRAVGVRLENDEKLSERIGWAMAWLHVVFGGRALAVGRADDGQAWLREAVRCDPRIAGSRRIEAIEHIARTWDAASRESRCPEPVVATTCQNVLGATPRDLRRARARSAMARFFAARARGEAAAAHELRAGIWMDPTWLLNRGVLAYFMGRVRRSARDQDRIGSNL